MVPPLLRVVDDTTTNGLGRFRHPAEQRERPGLVEIFVEVAAFRALYAGGAAALAGTALEQADGVRHSPFELLEAALGHDDPSRMAVEDAHSLRSRVPV